MLVQATSIRLSPDPSRVVARPFFSHTGGLPDHRERLIQIAHRVADQTPEEATSHLDYLRRHFSKRHRDLEGTWLRHLEMVCEVAPEIESLATPPLDLLLGAAFTQEYALEGAALTNPSMVPLENDEFLMSVRAIGEGHISSIEFRSGRVSSDGLFVDPPSPWATTAKKRVDHLHDAPEFGQKLDQMEAHDHLAGTVLNLLPKRFSSSEVEKALDRALDQDTHPLQAESTRHMFRWLTSSNYSLTFDGQPLSERVLFPAGPLDSHGMEDARFVRFEEDDGTVRFFATYTAFDGTHILPQLIETSDFVSFEVSSLHGSAAQNKGMALFPRRVGGRFLALSRHDQTNLHVLATDDVWRWNRAEPLTGPVAAWEPIQIGNCGSPIETEEGWLVITHGVGPMRIYQLGALLLDREDPSVIIGRLRRPLLSPSWEDRDGYVPNVVYSCGSMRWRDQLILPFGINDREVGVARIDLDELITALE